MVLWDYIDIVYNIRYNNSELFRIQIENSLFVESTVKQNDEEYLEGIRNYDYLVEGVFCYMIIGEKNCLICGGGLKVSHLGKGILECRNCGFFTTNEELSTDELIKLYSEDYFHGEEYADYTSDEGIITHNFEKRLKKMKHYLLSHESIFEIGCAYGFFLKVASKIFDEVEGIDISEDAVKYAREVIGVNAISGNYLEYKCEKLFDCICMWDVIEHLTHPADFINHAYVHQKKGGIICITTGDVGSINAKLRGAKWRQVHPPTHLHYFDKRTITMLLQKIGYKVENISYPSNIISLKTVLYTVFCLKHNWKKLYFVLEKIGLTKINISFNLHDYMFVIARKQ